MSSRIFLLVVALCLSCHVSSTPEVDIEDLQGAWWSDEKNPTADFAIYGNRVWLDFDSSFHPCSIQGDLLIFDLGHELGRVKNRILSIEGDVLVLESQSNGKKTTLIRVKE